jgi:hypothetical protein
MCERFFKKAWGFIYPMDAIFAHSSEHIRHISAHFVQCLSSKCAHSSAHIVQICAQSRQCCVENLPSIDIIAAEVWHIMAHSISMLMHFVLFSTSGSFKHSLKHS